MQQAAQLGEEKLARLQAEVSEANQHIECLNESLQVGEAQLRERADSAAVLVGERDCIVREAQHSRDVVEAQLCETSDQLASHRERLTMSQRVAAEAVQAKGELERTQDEASRLGQRGRELRETLAARQLQLKDLTATLDEVERAASEAEDQAEALRKCEARLEESEQRAQRRSTRLRAIEDEIAALKAGRTTDLREIEELRAYAAAGAAAIGSSHRCVTIPDRIVRRHHKKESCNAINYDTDFGRSRSLGAIPATSKVPTKVLPQTPPKVGGLPVGLPQISLPNGFGRAHLVYGQGMTPR